MAKYTSRYGFELPEGVDKVAPTPFNENFKKIDGLIKALDKKYIVKGYYTGNGVISTIGQIAEQSIDLGAKPVMLILDTSGTSRPHNLHNANSLYGNDFAHDIMTFGRPEVTYKYDDRDTYTIAKLTDNGFKVMQCGYTTWVDGKKKASSQGYNKQGKEYYYIAFCDELPGNADAGLAEDKAQMNYLGELGSLPDTVVAGDACTVDGSLYVFYDGGWIKASGGGSSGGGFKKIGYSDDCDYKVVSAASALAVFNTALTEANDGDTILIMPGAYAGSGEFLVNKNLTFVGIGDVVIKFDVKTDCVYYFDENDYQFVTVATYLTTWHGIHFEGKFTVSGEDVSGYCINSTANCFECCFENAFVKTVGIHRNCTFKVNGVLTSGHYYGAISYYYDCQISCASFTGGDNYCYNSDIHFLSESQHYNTFGAGGQYIDCNIYLHRTNISDECDHSYILFERCNFYGNAIEKNVGTYTNCFKYAGTAL